MWSEAQNFALVKTELDRVFFQEFQYDNTDPGIATAATAQLFKPMQIDRAAYVEEEYKGSSLFPVVGELQNIPTYTPSAGNKKTTYVLKFLQGVTLSNELFKDNMHGVWAATVRDLALKARVTQDNNAFKVFRNGFTTTLTIDGTAWFASHTLLNGSTYSNLLTGVLNPTNLNDAIVKLREQPDTAGVILGNAPAYLVVPSKLFKYAREITDSALLADTGNNNVNVYRSAYGFSVWSSPYLGAAAGGSDTAWFLLARNHTVTRIIREGINTFLRDYGYSTDDSYFYRCGFREETYVVNYIGSVGSTGTTATN